MENADIKQVVIDLFAGADERNWQKVENTFAAEVLLDYTSMNGGQPAELTPKQIVDAWAGFLPGFDKTHHQLSGLEITENGTTATAHYFARAAHLIGQEEWIVEGNYETVLENTSGSWKISKHKLMLAGQFGNTGLPAKAAERVKQLQ